MAEVIRPNPIAKVAVLVIAGLLISEILHSFFGNASFFLQVLVGLWGAIVLITMMLYALDRFITLELSEQGFIYREGIFSVKRVHINFTQITSVNMRQTLIERIFGLGTIEVDTPSSPIPEISAHSMPFSALKKIVDEINDKLST